MLRELYIENFAIIDKLQINFKHHFNVITGETGSGKSILIEALDLICGQRFNKKFIKDKNKPTIVEGTVELKDRELKHFNEAGYYPEDHTVIITRIIDQQKSIHRINGRNVSLSVLSTLMNNLIDIHGQNSNTSLLKKDNYLNLLDRFLKEEIRPLKEKIKESMDAYHNVKKESERLILDEAEKDRELDILKFQINEIKDLDLSNMDEKKLDDEYAELSNMKSIKDALNQIESLSHGGYEGSSLIDMMDVIRKELINISEYSNELQEFTKRFEALYFDFEEFLRDVITYNDRMEEDEEKLFELNQRIEQLTAAKRKYGKTIEKMIAFQNKAIKRYDELIEIEKFQHLYREQMAKYLKTAINHSEKLTGIRKKIAKKLENDIIKSLKELNMPHTKFKVTFTKKKLPDETGMDKVDFLISTNPGQDLKPLQETASGGEISRIMLGFKSTIASIDRIDTLIFDEIDTGISGRTAQIVGEKLTEISKNCQVISISHLPQIAALADHHLLITKNQNEESTISDVITIERQQRIDELARLIGGVNITDITKKSAKEMIEQATKLKRGRYNEE